MNTNKINAALPPQMVADVDYLVEKHGYSHSEIVREGIRLLVSKKRAEASA